MASAYAATLPLLGEHNIYNALAGVAVGLHYGVPLSLAAQSLATLSAGDKRGEILSINGATIINDCYNSNPKALDSMVRSLAQIPARRRIVVAGEMFGARPRRRTDASRGRRAHSAEWSRFPDRCTRTRARDGRGREGRRNARRVRRAPEEAGEWLRREIKPGDVILLKASRGVRLERALEVWTGAVSAEH